MQNGYPLLKYYESGYHKLQYLVFLMDEWGIAIWFLAGKRDFSLFQNVQAGLLCSGQWELIPQGVKVQNEADRSLPCSAEARK